MKNNHDIRLTEAYNHAMASDYYRKQKHKRISIDILIFFFIGLLIMTLVELVIAW